MEPHTAWLPPVNDAWSLPLPHFPTKWQAVLFRLWEMVPAEKLAAVLGTDAATVTAAAEAMALPAQKDTAVWRERGYITILRAVWPLLPYEQILQLLDMDEAELAFTLKEDDFLSHKFGNAKFPGDPVRWESLTPAQQAATERLADVMRRCIRPYDAEETAAPFDFFPETDRRKTAGPRPADCAAVDEAWTLEDRTGDPDCAGYAADFAADMEAVWGIALRRGPQDARCITVTLDPALAGEPEEYHELDVRPDGIDLRATGPMGVIRGFSLLLTLMDAAGGPYIPCGKRRRRPVFDARYIYSYCGLYGAPLDVDTQISFPDALLREYARVGANGVWLQGVLYKLTPFPFEPSQSEGYQKRLERLRELIARARRCGLKVYLYINEPRAMPLAFFDRHPDLKGFERRELASLCTSHPAVQAYLRDSIRFLCENAPGLGGFFTISVSENQTNCYSHAAQHEQTCPRCKNRRREEVVAEVNSIIADAAHSVDPSIRTIVWTWGWKSFGDEARLRAIGLLSENCIVQCTSEEMMDIRVGGLPVTVVDYTMSQIPPSEQSRENWRQAKATGHRTSAKVQLCTTWEGSTAPYIPVWENLTRYMENLRAEGVGNLQLSWTLGGYPSENLRIASAHFFDETCEGCAPLDYPAIVRAAFGEHAPAVQAAVHRFCEAFAEFPFHVGTLYTGPQNGGASNLLFEKPTGLTATMTCWPYDDLERWRSVYPLDLFEAQFEKLSRGWNEGLALLEGLPDCEFRDVAAYCSTLFESSLNQIRFIRARDAYLAAPDAALREKLLSLLASERGLAVRAYRIMLRRPCIGYEAANHYYVSRSMLMEKVLNCEYLLSVFAAE